MEPNPVLRIDPTIPPPPAVGARVEHSVFGPGEVVPCDGTREPGGAIRVRFDRHGVKELLWVFAHSRFAVLPPPAAAP